MKASILIIEKLGNSGKNENILSSSKDKRLVTSGAVILDFLSLGYK